MSDIKLKTLPKLYSTKKPGVYFKYIQRTVINAKGDVKTNNKYDKVFIIRYRDNGKQRFITIGKYSEGVREDYCANKLIEFKAMSKHGELPPQIEKRIKRDAWTLNKMADNYFNDRKVKGKLSQSDKKQRGRYELHLQPKFGDKDISKLTRADFKNFQNNLKRAPKTVNGIIALGRAIINYNIKEHDANVDNPMSNITPLAVGEDEGKRDRFLSKDEIRELISAVSDDDILLRFVLMALGTGARLKTVLNIKVKNINLNEGTITLYDFKRGMQYKAHIDSDKHMEVIAKHIKGKKPDDLYLDVPDRTVQRRLKPVLDRLFNEGLAVDDTKHRTVIHTLRHTFASHLVIRGVPLLQVRDLLNHAKIEMTERYAHLAPEGGRKAVRGLYE